MLRCLNLKLPTVTASWCLNNVYVFQIMEGQKDPVALKVIDDD